MLDIVRKVSALLSQRERRQLYLLFVAILGMALLQTTSVISIMPFLSVASNPSAIESNRILHSVYEFFGFTSTNQFLFALGLAVLVLLLISNALLATVTWFQLRYVHMRNHSLSRRLLENYLHQPYSFFLGRNSSDLSKNILSEAQQVTVGILMPGLQMLARSIIVLLIVALLFIVDPILSILVAIVGSGLYGAIYMLSRNYLSQIGMKRVSANKDRYKSASEALRGIKELKLLGKEETFLQQFTAPSIRFAIYQANSQVISQIPRYGLELVAFGTILAAALYLLIVKGTLREAIPVLGLYAFAGYRLMPALQQVFSSITRIRFSTAALNNLYDELVSANNTSTPEVNSQPLRRPEDRLPLKQKLELRDVTFYYPGTTKPALKQVSLTIDANTTVGLVGETGSGKTTTVDILLGLLAPQTGTMLVDEVDVYDGWMRTWQNNLGYVPQFIYLSDDTVAGNIAFGVPKENIDSKAVQRAASIAHIHDFVETELPQGYNTYVGEQGVRLSGGQRQRIGIARALYHNPGVLVLDEATSSLDNKTEQSVMDAIYSLSHQKTIIIISHRSTTVEACDRIYVLDQGQIVEDKS